MGSDRFDALSQAVLAIARAESLEAVLRRVLGAAVDLVDARYGALGIPDESGTGFDRFLTVGMDDDLIAELGELPRTHGMLGAMLTSTRSERLDDLTADPRFGGWWPKHHPIMRSFLGVPVVYDDRVTGAIYLTEKRSAPRFSARDQSLVESLAAHAAIAIEQARLRRDQRQLAIVAERDRLARELHDALGQTLFSLSLRAATLRDEARHGTGPDPARLDELAELARTARRELRAVVLGLRPPDLAVDGLPAALAKLVDVLRSTHRTEITFTGPATGVEVDLGDEVEQALWRVAQEGLTNAVRHAGASHIDVHLALHQGDRAERPLVELCISDDGTGFDPDAPAVKGRHLGLRSIRDRVQAVGGGLDLTSSPAGTVLRATVPLGRPAER